MSHNYRMSRNCPADDAIVLVRGQEEPAASGWATFGKVLLWLVAIGVIGWFIWSAAKAGCSAATDTPGDVPILRSILGEQRQRINGSDIGSASATVPVYFNNSNNATTGCANGRCDDFVRRDFSTNNANNGSNGRQMPNPFSPPVDPYDPYDGSSASRDCSPLEIILTPKNRDVIGNGRVDVPMLNRIQDLLKRPQ